MTKFGRILSVTLAFAVCLALIGGIAMSQSAARGAKKTENTDAALRLKWFDNHVALKSQTPFGGLTWRYIGPEIISGRCTDVEAVPGNRNLIYAASATGGFWKTTNGGTTWEPLTDGLPTPSMGDMAISPKDPDVVWLGTGEANIFRASVAGTGIYKTTDGGKTWTHLGLEGTGTIARIVIHPVNTDIVYVAASGNEWTYNPDRGVYKTTDGGKTWQKILYKDEKTGAIDLVMDPVDHDTVYASTWNRIRRRWSDPVPEDGDYLHKTTDGGKTWKTLTNGLPDTKLTGRIGIDIARSNPNVLYAFVDNHHLGRMPKEGERDAYGRLKTGPSVIGAEVYRSDDKGESWRKVSPESDMMERFSGTYGWVFGQIRVDPTDENTLYIMGVPLAKSTDGGKSFQILYFEGLHGDHHGLWIDPTDPDYLINANDGGVNVSFDGGTTWRAFHKELPLIQFYNVSLDMESPFNVYGSVQDHGTYKGNVDHFKPRQRGRRGPVTRWESAPGGEGTLIAIDPVDPTVVYSSTFYGRLQRSEFRDGFWQSKDVQPRAGEGEPPLRGQWLAPTLLSPHNPHVVYHGFQYLFRSMNRGETWERISPDLTYNDPAKQGKLPYAIPYACLTAVSESPFAFGVIYAGTDDGRVWVTRNSGANWTEITAGLPYNKHVSRIVASAHDPAVVYLTLNGRRDDDFAAYIYKSADYGKTWKSIQNNLPGAPVNVVREDPMAAHVLYAGTELGPFVSTDGGASWNYLGSGLPKAPLVWDLKVHPRDNAVVIATYGRGIWVIDDISAVRTHGR